MIIVRDFDYGDYAKGVVDFIIFDCIDDTSFDTKSISCY